MPAQVDPIKQAQAKYRYQKAYLQNITALELFPDATVSPQGISIPESEQEVDLSQFRPDDWQELEDIEENDGSDSFIDKVDPLLERRLPCFCSLHIAGDSI